MINRYEGQKNTRLSKEYTERLRLRQKYKREFKSTTRALIRDTEFIGREELRQQMEKYIFSWFLFDKYYFLFLLIEMLNENAKSKRFKQI